MTHIPGWAEAHPKTWGAMGTTSLSGCWCRWRSFWGQHPGFPARGRKPWEPNCRSTSPHVTVDRRPCGGGMVPDRRIFLCKTQARNPSFWLSKALQKVWVFRFFDPDPGASGGPREPPWLIRGPSRDLRQTKAKNLET
jgi:hypothetical protein